MKTFTIASITSLLLASTALATPVDGFKTVVKARAAAPATVTINFFAVDNVATQTIPIDGQTHYATTALSIDHISVQYGFICTFVGIDAGKGVVPTSYTVSGAAGRTPIGPPQEITTFTCGIAQ